MEAQAQSLPLFSSLSDSFLRRECVHVYRQLVFMSKFIPNFRLRGVHNSIVCFPEVRPQWRGWPEQILGASPGHLNKEYWIPWHLESDLKRESWAPGGTCSWLHVSVGLWEKVLRVDPRNTLRGTWKWEKEKRKSMKGVLISTLLLWTPRAPSQCEELCGMNLRITLCREWSWGTYTNLHASLVEGCSWSLYPQALLVSPWEG